MIGFIGSKHARGLIEDQGFGALEEGFQNFNALLEAHGQFTDDGIGIDVELVVMGQAGELGAGLVDARLGEILEDAAKRIEEAGCRVSVFRAGYRFDPSAEVCVASLQTSARLLDELPEGSRIIVDECHGSEAPTVKAVLARYPAARLLGLTATPARGDGQPLAEFQKLVCGPSVGELVALGRLVPTRLFTPPAVLDKGVARDPVEVMLERAHRRFAVFAPDAAQADRIAREASASGHTTVAVLDGMGREARRGIRARLESG